MKREHIRKLIPLYLDEELDSKETKLVDDYLETNPDFQREIDAFERSWDMLDEWAEIEPSPGYMSRFWTELSMQKPWHEELVASLKQRLVKPRLAPALATVCIALIVGYLVTSNYIRVQEADKLLAQMKDEDIEFLENMEFAENFEIIEDLEFLEDLEMLEQWNTIGS